MKNHQQVAPETDHHHLRLELAEMRRLSSDNDEAAIKVLFTGMRLLG